jgi:transposase InsO family protein
MKAIADTMGVARSHLAERTKRRAKSARCRYNKADDGWLLPLIRELVDCRSTYGYRRICALLNRKLEEAERPAVNHKRVYRIMRQNGLLLTRHTGKQRALPHEGNVITLRSNSRWCSDGFEIACWNGQVVRVAFALDCCDREIISHVATTSGITGEMVRDLMTESAERRFGMVDLLPHRVEWLSDNGSCYTANETTAFAKDIGFISCFTPVRSPESNGMAEAFVKTIKRDYARVSARPDAASVLRQLDGWFEHYNTVHPHKALGYRSPREFRNVVVEKTTENAVGAVRRPHEGTTATEAVGSRPQPPQAVVRSASLDASAAVDHP